ncbi:hypothetical protein evm_006099 [Chilo suppressalis]|nr:hypothetical protein evm_006099 [Chilo suppressalis]
MISVHKIFLIFVVLCSLGELVLSAPQPVFYNIEDAGNLFQEFMVNFNKQYATLEEKQRRLQVFTKNLEIINRKNADENESAVFGVNQFSDLSDEEFKAIYLNYLPSEKSPCSQISTNYSGILLPDNLDWRQKNVVTRVKSQESCGACWAFAAVGNIESMNAIKNGQLLEFSEQQLVDCTSDQFDCHQGGRADTGIMKVIEAGGIMGEDDYPYENQKGQCRFQSSQVKATVTNCYVFSFQNEDEIKQALFENGPIAMALNGEGLKNYQGGVYKQCFGDVDHAVLLVGYGEDPSDGPYWLIKNSWGVTYGDKGYAKLLRNQNTCNMMGGTFSTAAM